MAFNKITFTIIFLLLVAFGFSQQPIYKYVINFANKDNTGFSIDKPGEFLSLRAIERREKQGISLAISDLPINSNYIDSILETKGLSLMSRSKWFNAIVVELSDTTVMAKVAKKNFVKSVYRLPGSPDKSGLVNNDKLEQVSGNELATYGLSYGASLNQLDMLDGKYLHNLGYTGKGMLIAVIDAGFSKVNELDAFQRLREENRIVGTRDFVENDEDIYAHSNHGTLVLSTMASWLPGELIGTAPDANYLLLRSEDGSGEDLIEEYYWAEAAEYADSAGADIINTSLGYTTFNDADQNHTYMDMDGNTTFITKASDVAAGKGMLVINSAGNSGNNSWRYISAPADGDSVLAVGAVDPDGNYAYFSSVGPSYDERIKPNVAVQGLDAVVAALEGGVVKGNGTSFASPILAGMAACLWQAHPEASAMQIFHAIEEGSSQYTKPGGYLGYGIPNFALSHLKLLNSQDDNGESDRLLAAMPNPFHNQLYFYIYSQSGNPVELKLVDMSGRTILKKKYAMQAGRENLLKLNDVNLLSQGVYILQVELDGKLITEKLVKQ